MSMSVRKVYLVPFVCLGLALFSSFPLHAQPSAVEQGRELALSRAKGNCMACHQIPGVDFHGDIAPPLVAMKARFPDRKRLHDQIYDATQFNPNSVMPPYGKHDFLSTDEIDKIVEWLYTL